MNNNIKKLATITAVLYLSLSPALAPTGRAAAEDVTSTAPDSHPLEKSHRPHSGKEGKFRAGGHFIIFESAKLLEMDRTELINNLKAGKTLPELAFEKKGWTEDQYIQKLSESASQRLDQAITEGRLTKDEAQKLKAGLPSMLKQRISKMGHFQDRKPSEHHVINP
ncbi:hypothetical protein [Paenibacillus sp.]|uniref:hypothetical protein n=1 Tax=Paenibacillus sp. TaxID=58172 RepID=UPI0028AF8298|nr:hypothetical protein [Paenibacillus sp.]